MWLVTGFETTTALKIKSCVPSLCRSWFRYGDIRLVLGRGFRLGPKLWPPRARPPFFSLLSLCLVSFSPAVFLLLLRRSSGVCVPALVWDFEAEPVSRCRFLWKPWRVRPSRSRSRAAIPSTMWRPKSRTRKVRFLQFPSLYLSLPVFSLSLRPLIGFENRNLIANFCFHFGVGVTAGSVLVLLLWESVFCSLVWLSSSVTDFIIVVCVQEFLLTSNVSSLPASSSRMDALWPITTFKRVSFLGQN